MNLSPQLVPAVYSLTAVLMWGTSDFLGGFGARKTNAYLLTAITHTSALGLALLLSFGSHATLPSASAIRWSVLAGTLGGSALALFYRALGKGQMGLTAPVSAVLGAAIPALVGIFTDGIPKTIVLVGFALAAGGIWLIAKPEGDALKTKGLAQAIGAGVGFALFYLCIHRAGDASAFWGAAFSRAASLTVVVLLVLVGRHFEIPSRPAILIGLVTGILDVTGTVLFIRAEQTGRLDSAVVLSSLYPAVTVLLARFFLRERFTPWKAVGMAAALVAVPMIAGR